MAETFIQAKFTEQMPFVGTVAQRTFVDSTAARLECSRAAVIRMALDNFMKNHPEGAESQ